MSKMMAVSALCLVGLWAGEASAQSAASLPVDMRKAGNSVSPLEVDDDTLVMVRIEKTTFQACTVETKTEQLASPANPIGQALAALTPFLGGAALAGTRPAVPSGDEVLEAQIVALQASADKALNDASEQRTKARAELLSLPARVACIDKICQDPNEAADRLTLIRGNLGKLVDEPAVPVALLNARIASISKALVDKAAQGVPARPHGWQMPSYGSIGSKRLFDGIADRRQSLSKAKEALAPVLERLDTFKPATFQIVPLSVARNARTTVTVKCTNVLTQEPKIYQQSEDRVSAEEVPPATTTVVYANAPWAVVTAGFLRSQVDKRQIGASPFATGKDATGTATFERRVAETDSASNQMIPFTFLNLALCPCRKVTPTATVGFGLNTNNGGKVLEYFVGVGLIIRGQLAIQIGKHLGTRQEPAHGFVVGDLLSDKLTAVPTTRTGKQGLAIGLSFKVPLPK